MFNLIRGTKDILPQDQKYWDYFKDNAFELADIYGFERIDTPTFEMTDLFLRGIGIGTDIVNKETYTFLDRGENNITLRPEGTASVCRAYIQNGMHNDAQPKKLYYFTSIFRYERPQSGRLREHHQFGIETIGNNDAELDGEIINFAWTLLKKLGLKHINLKINTIGNTNDRNQYIKSLTKYYLESKWSSSECIDCNQRIKVNPLRILDCKNNDCKNFIASAPAMFDYASKSTLEHFEKVKNYLDLSEIPYTIDSKLVRGLDYYTNTVFEITSDQNKSQNALVGGGRYDGLIEQLGGSSTPGSGFGMGVERVINEIISSKIEIPTKNREKILFTSINKKSFEQTIKFKLLARSNDIKSELSTINRSLKSTMRYANNKDFSHIIIVGDNDEENLNYISIKNLSTGKQSNVNEKQLSDFLNKIQ